jgi:hypothetical protein
MQTLTTLNLKGNQIGFGGARYIANELYHNTVKLVLNSYISYASISRNLDTHHAES